eukprot:12417504-Karenia_brevis.AAC.1
MPDEPVTPEGEKPLDEERRKKYQSIVARANFLELDRPEIQFAVKECARVMSSPTEGDQARLKRLGRYLKGHPRTTVNYRWQSELSEVSILTDANWAGDKKSWKSTGGGAICIGGHLINS